MTETPEVWTDAPDDATGYSDSRPTDDRGRVQAAYCTDRELLIEMVTHMRVVSDVVSQLGESPAVAAMMGGSNPMMAMLRNG